MRYKRWSIVYFAIWVIAFLDCSSYKISPPAPLLPIPSASQLEWHNMEQYAFIHFSINTFTDKEWGYGDESPGLFQPDSLNVQQWVNLFKEVGFKAVIITAKHHDGFCLWPSQYTEHSIKNSPYKNGNGDIIKELAEACKNAGLKFGIYVSPWDRNNKDYGTPAYIDYYRSQLNELINNYGPFFEMWFDGANGGDGYYGGADEVRRIDGSKYYHWEETIEMVKKVNPGIIFFSDAGPGVRWVGNENGIAGETNWNMITPDTLFAGKSGITNLLNTGSEDGTDWIPAEVDVSIRPGWFFHESQNSRVKTPEDLFRIYLSSVGRGSNLLLNVPPDKRGLINEIDQESLRGFKKLVDEAFGNNLAKDAFISASDFRGKVKQFSPENMIDENKDTYWATNDEVQKAEITIEFENAKQIKFIVLAEPIQMGQRIKRFSIEANLNGNWVTVSEATTIGHKRIISYDNLLTARIRITILETRACPLISEIGIY